MGALVEERVRDAIAALLERQADLAERGRHRRRRGQRRSKIEVDDLCLKLLALQHPMASDLRLIRSAIKINTDLERIGDQAVNIAEARDRAARPRRR